LQGSKILKREIKSTFQGVEMAQNGEEVPVNTQQIWVIFLCRDRQGVEVLLQITACSVEDTKNGTRSKIKMSQLGWLLFIRKA
jgi:hypothetical protein